MKFTLTRTDAHGTQRYSMRNAESVFDEMTCDTKQGDISEYRSMLKLRDYEPCNPDGMRRQPFIYPVAELQRDRNGNVSMRRLNGLVLLSFGQLTHEGDRQVVRRLAQALPMTLAVFDGASGTTVKVMVRVTVGQGALPVNADEAERFLDAATRLASRIYSAAVGRPAEARPTGLRSCFRRTLDEHPYYNADAVPLRVDLLMPEVATPQPQQEAQVDGAPGSDRISDGTRQLVDFLRRRYDFRFNMVMGYTECRPVNQLGAEWQPVDDRKRNGLAMQARLAGLDVWDKDINRYVMSDMVVRYHPVREYLWSLHGKWDGRDHIGRLAATVLTDNPLWPSWFRTWLLAMVAQWMGLNSRYGNAVAPLLISTQGYNKSTFCRSLLPDELSWGYNDNLLLSEKKAVMQQMSQMLLINLDEFNQISPAIQQGFLKNLIQLPSVKVKRPYGKHVEEQPRMASFIATSNLRDILADPSGCRRFLGIELTGPIDVSVRPNHRQLYAQALALLDANERYWFNDEETLQIMRQNQRFRLQSTAEQYFFTHFEPAQSEADGEYLSAAAIFERLRRFVGSSLKAQGLTSFGRTLAHIDGLQRKRSATATLYLVKMKD